MIGSLGDIVFVASTQRVRTFRDASHDTAARVAHHEIAGRGVRHEHLGHDAVTLSLTVQLSHDLGVDVRGELQRLREITESGTILPLILGDEYEGDYILITAGEQWTQIGSAGIITDATVVLSLERYGDA